LVKKTERALGNKKGNSVKEYEFEVAIVAVVRVQATDEEAARKVVPTVLGAAGSVEIRQANEKSSSRGVEATVTDVRFSAEAAVIRAADDKIPQPKRVMTKRK
jgi:ribosomal protein L16/L10AE